MFSAYNIIIRICAINALSQSEDSVRKDTSVSDILSMYATLYLNGTKIEDINKRVHLEYKKVVEKLIGIKAELSDFMGSRIIDENIDALVATLKLNLDRKWGSHLIQG